MKAAAGGEGGVVVKDDDAIKLFVGQVPKDMEEDALRQYFADFGEIFDLTIIRDKITGLHRGCAFLTFTTKGAAEAAVDALHNKCKLPNAQNPLQVRPADVHSDRESKLFVGMLPKTVDDVLLESIFSPYGKIKEIHIIRTQEGEAKGCAFLKFMDKSSAIRAIEELHEKRLVDGSSRPLVVKFADTKRPTPGLGGLGGGPGAIRTQVGGKGGSGDGDYSYWVMGPHGQPQGPQGYSPYHQSAAGPAMGLSPYMPPYGSVSPYNQQMYHYPAYYNAQHGGGSSSYPSPGTPGQHAGSYPYSGVAGAGAGGGVHGGRTGSPEGAHAMPSAQSPTGPQPFGGRHNSNKPLEGPPGANLFIYHLPHDLTDADLATAFNPFGTVISAKVYVDKVTGESKGFGFVSYDSAPAAESAIKSMNGFQIGTKRLKVQHKRISHHHPQQMPQSFPAYQQPGQPPYMGPPFDPHHHQQQQAYQGSAATAAAQGAAEGGGASPDRKDQQKQSSQPAGKGSADAGAAKATSEDAGAGGDGITLEHSMNRLSLA